MDLHREREPMRFALLGDEADGLDMARAMVGSGRHEFIAYAGKKRGWELLLAEGVKARPVGDFEEILADPAVEAVIVASPLSVRPAELRRVLQSERHALCVYPPDLSLDSPHEAAMIQGDTGVVLFPLLKEGLHPAVSRLEEFLRSPSKLGTFRLLEVHRSLPSGDDSGRSFFPGWDLLRRLRGEIVEVVGYAAHETATTDEPIIVSGRFERGGIFQLTFLPGPLDCGLNIRAHGSQGRAHLDFPAGFSGPVRLSLLKNAGQASEDERWEPWSPWAVLVTAFEEALARPRNIMPGGQIVAPAQPGLGAAGQGSSVPMWQDAIRGLELDDAVRRSIERRRASTLEYQEATEEAGFKGTMTLVGCSLLWGMLLLVVLSRWFPKLGWLIIPLLAVFLGLQLLRWVVPRAKSGHE
jgi:predicted dehydrogenase